MLRSLSIKALRSMIPVQFERNVERKWRVGGSCLGDQISCECIDDMKGEGKI